jgi:DNA-binding transcriptional ArsR family regulator
LALCSEALLEDQLKSSTTAHLLLNTDLSHEAANVQSELRLCPITKRQERILRTVASKFYKRGYCFAKHETLAAAVGYAKSTVQLDLDELEARGLITVRRRAGTSNVTVLIPGLIEALRAIRLERKRAEFIARNGAERVFKSIESSKTLLAVAMEELSSFAHGAMVSTAAKIGQLKSYTSSKLDSKNPFNYEQDHQILLNRPKAVQQPINTTSNVISAKASCDDAKKIKSTTAALRDAGVSPRQATKIIKIFGSERAELNLRLGLHQNAQNPGGFLATAIRENYAKNHVQQGSEAERVRIKEQSQKVNKHQVFGIKAAEKLAPEIQKSSIEYVISEFERLPAEKKQIFEIQAREAIATAPPTWIKSVLRTKGLDHVSVRGAIKTKAIEIWQSLSVRDVNAVYAVYASR